MSCTVEEKLVEVFEQHDKLATVLNERAEGLTNIVALVLLLAESVMQTRRANEARVSYADFRDDFRTVVRAAMGTIDDRGLRVELENAWQLLPELTPETLASTLFLLAVNRSHEPKIGAAALAAAAARYFEMYPPEQFDPAELASLADAMRANPPPVAASFSGPGINGPGGEA